jgi:hypothetical protein
MKAKPQSDGSSIAFTLVWITVTALALFAGKWLGQQFGFVLWPVSSVPPNGEILAGVTFAIPRLIIIGFTIGTMTSILQALLLRWYGHHLQRRWIVWTAVACGILPLLDKIMWEQSRVLALGSILAGGILGVVQWTVLRKTFHAAEWWIPTNAISGFFLFQAMMPSLNFDSGVIVFGLGYGAITGITAGYLMKHPVTRPVISYNHGHG